MPGFVQNTGVDIQTTLPNVTPVGTQSESIGPQVVETLANAGSSFYRGYAIGAAEDDAQEVLQQFDADLQAAEDAGTVDAFVDSQLTTIANESPEYQGVVNELRRISQANDQGTAPRLLLQLRAEAALKRSINRAPGLRSEITRAARDTLGFDPSGALINALLNSKNSDSSQRAADIQWAARQDFQYLQNNPEAGPAVFDANGNLDFQANREKVQRYQAVEATQNTIREASEQKSITELDTIVQFEQSVTEGLSLQFSNLTAGVRNILGSVRSSDQLRAARPQLRSLLTQLQQSADAYVDRQYNGLRTSGPAAEEAQASRQRTKQNALGGIQRLLEEDDFTVVEQNVAMLEFLQKELKMNFVDSNSTLSYMQTNMPGWIQSVYPTLLTRDLGTEQRVRDLVASAVNFDPNFLRQTNMRNQLATLTDVRAFEGLSESERRAVATANYGILEEAVRDVQSATASPDAVNVIGNAYATVAQLIDPSNTEDSRRAINLLADPRFVTLADSMVNSQNGEITSEVVADSAIATMSNYVRNAGIPDIAGTDISELASYDYSTGMFTLPDRGTAEVTTGSMTGIPRVTGIVITRRDRETVRTLNRAIDGIYNLRRHDPSIASLSRSEVAQYIVGGRLQGINTVGSPAELVLPEQATQRQQRVDFNQTVRATSDAIASTIARLDSDSELTAELTRLSDQINNLSNQTPQ